MYSCTKLKSGLQVATAEVPHMASSCVGLWVNVGGRHESKDENGAAHFIEHMLFKGTPSRDARQISEEIEGLGGYLNAFTAEENTCYYAKASSEHSDKLIDVLFDMFLNATFQPEEVRKERAVILEENAMYLDQPHQLVLEKMNELLWPRHPMGRSITGTTQSLRRLNREELLRFRKQHYTAANVLLAGAGNITHKALVKRARQLANKLPIGKPAPFERVQRLNDRFNFRFIPRQVEQAQLAISFKTCSRHDRRQYALQVLNTLLGENMSSRLFQVLREQHGLAYNVYSNLGSFADGGTLTIAVGLDPNNVGRAIKLIDHELKQLRSTPPTKAEVDRAAQYLNGQLDLHLENTENHMIWIGEQALGFGNIRSADSIKSKIRAVTPEAIQGVATDFFQRKTSRIALVGPKAKGIDPPADFLVE